MAGAEPKELADQLISSLPSHKGWAAPLVFYSGCWYVKHHLRGAIPFCNTFKPRDSDILLISQPKSGTTWLKALAFATVRRNEHSPSDPNHPLLHHNPHRCVPVADMEIALGAEGYSESSERLLHLHMPVEMLPRSVLDESECKIVYICREPKDAMVSTWHFCKELMVKETREPIPFGEAFELYCDGVSPFGPVWEHQLGYWRESLRRPEKILFLKYEDVMADTAGCLKKLAEFVGFPFSEEEEKEGMVEGIVKLCSFENLRATKVNREESGEVRIIDKVRIKNSSYFRKGVVGDWKNHLTPEMAQKLDEITRRKLHGSGLSFD